MTDAKATEPNINEGAFRTDLATTELSAVIVMLSFATVIAGGLVSCDLDALGWISDLRLDSHVQVEF